MQPNKKKKYEDTIYNKRIEQFKYCYDIPVDDNLKWIYTGYSVDLEHNYDDDYSVGSLSLAPIQIHEEDNKAHPVDLLRRFTVEGENPNQVWPYEHRIGARIRVKYLRVQGWLVRTGGSHAPYPIRIMLYRINRFTTLVDKSRLYRVLEQRLGPKDDMLPIWAPFKLEERKYFELLHEAFIYTHQHTNTEGEPLNELSSNSTKNIQNNTTMNDHIIDIKLNNIDLEVYWGGDVGDIDLNAKGKIFFAACGNYSTLPQDTPRHVIRDLTWTIGYTDD